MERSESSEFCNIHCWVWFGVIGFLVSLLLSWYWPITPPGDGPYQTLNWIARIKSGQIPGRDFDVFHGVGLIWFQAVIAWPANSVRGLIWSHFFGSLLAQWMLWSVVMAGRGAAAKKSMMLAAGLCGAMSLTTGIPFFNIAALTGAGHSMVGARVGLVLLCLVGAWVAVSRGKIQGAGIPFLMGLAAGTGAWIATDQTIAIAGSTGLYMALGTMSSIRTSRRKVILWHPPIWIAVTLVTYGGLLWLGTAGHAKEAVAYWWRLLPDVQFWYFGGPPNPFVKGWKDLLIPDLGISGCIGAGLHVLGWRYRKKGMAANHLALVFYGVLSLLPLAGMIGSHYLSGLWCSGMIAVLWSECPGHLAGPIHRLLGNASVLGAGCLAIALMGFRTVQVQMKNASRVEDVGALEVPLAGTIAPPPGARPAFLDGASPPGGDPHLLRAFYRALPEISLGQAGVGRFDYIIHALGDAQRQEYMDSLVSAPPTFLRVPSQSGFPYAQWLWHQWPELWEWILVHYRLELVTGGSAYWKRMAEPVNMIGRKVATMVSQESDGLLVRAVGPLDPDSLLKVKVTYRTSPMGGLEKRLNRLTRVTVTGSGVADGQPFAWPPGGGDVIHRDVLVIPDGEWSGLRIRTEGPAFVSSLELIEASAEELRPSDLAGLKATLK